MDKSYFFDRFVMRRNYRELIISLEDGDKKIKELAEHSGMAYQHVCNVLQEAQKEGIMTSKKKDHSFNFSLTSKGKVIKELCVGLKLCIENWDEEKTIDSLNNLNFIKKQTDEPKELKEPKDNSVITLPKDGVKNGIKTATNSGRATTAIE